MEKMLQGMLSRPHDRAQAVEKPAEKPADKSFEIPANEQVEKSDQLGADNTLPDEGTCSSHNNKGVLLLVRVDIKPLPSLFTGDALLSAKEKLKPTEVESITLQLPVTVTMVL